MRVVGKHPGEVNNQKAVFPIRFTLLCPPRLSSPEWHPFFYQTKGASCKLYEVEPTESTMEDLQTNHYRYLLRQEALHLC